MYEWKQSSVERWLLLTDTYGHRHLVAVDMIRRAYEYLPERIPAFKQGDPKGVIVELVSGDEIKFADSLDSLIETITGKEK